ncbi:MAG: endonuclease V [Nanoarchaeota archaeon]
MVDVEKLQKEQLKLAKKVITKDDFDNSNLIAGCDQSYIEKKVISAVVVCDYKTKKVIEKSHAITDTLIPYIPGFLSYRESPAIIEAFNKLENKPDILMVDGNGILHFRRIGMASHIGILLDIPTIGVAKRLLCGDLKDGKVYMENEGRAIEFISREHAKPIYISPGHRISLKTSFEIVKNLMEYPHKLPEPLHIAHKLVTKLREELK